MPRDGVAKANGNACISSRVIEGMTCDECENVDIGNDIASAGGSTVGRMTVTWTSGLVLRLVNFKPNVPANAIGSTTDWQKKIAQET